MFSSSLRTYRNAYTGLSRSTWLLSLIMLINRSGTMVVPFMTLYMRSLGYSVADAGLIFGVFGLGSFFGAFVGGKLTDKLGSYPVQLTALSGGGILFIVLGQVHSYEWIAIVTFLLSFVNEAFRPANAAAIAQFSHEHNRTRSYSLNRLAINLGWAAGSALGGLLARIDYQLLFWVDGFTNISAALVLYFFLKPKPKTEKEIVPATPLTQVTRSAYQDKQFIFFILLTVLFASCFFQMFTNMPICLKENLHFGEPFIGLLMAISGIIIAAVEMVLVYKLENKGRDGIYIAMGTLLIGCGFMILNIPGLSKSGAFGLILALTFGEILAMPFMNSYWTRRADRTNRGQYAALYTMAWSAAQTIGPIAAAELADKQGFNLLWWIVGGICIITSFLFFRLLSAPR
ncbi:MFS transporter [Nostoc ellipsosporum NOK]|nr:MFS transporter [Nostoc ellipsosporum NOK]